PRVPVVVSGLLGLGTLHELADVITNPGERTTFGLAEAHRPDTGRMHFRGSFKRQRRGRKREQRIEIGLRRLGTSEERVEKTHAVTPRPARATPDPVARVAYPASGARRTATRCRSCSSWPE